jgi:hypothetical protein
MPFTGRRPANKCGEVQIPAAEPPSSMPSEAEAQQLRAEVQQLRMQLQERDAKEQQLLAENAALKVCIPFGQVGWITATRLLATAIQ